MNLVFKKFPFPVKINCKKTYEKLSTLLDAAYSLIILKRERLGLGYWNLQSYGVDNNVPACTELE